MFNYQEELDRIRIELGFDFGALALVESAEEKFLLMWKYTSGHFSQHYKKIVLKSGKGVAGTVFKTGKPLLVKNVDEVYEKEVLFNYPIVMTEKLKSYGAIPLWEDRRVAGVLLFGYRKAHTMTEEMFQQFQQKIGKNFGPLSRQELINQ